MSDDFDAHVRSGLDLGNDNWAHREFRLPDGSIHGYPADFDVPEGAIFIGVHHRHRLPEGKWCGGWIGFTNVNDPVDDHHHQHSKHQLIEAEPLTVAPSLLCRCGHHGFIQNGRWVGA